MPSSDLRGSVKPITSSVPQKAYTFILSVISSIFIGARSLYNINLLIRTSLFFFGASIINLSSDFVMKKSDIIFPCGVKSAENEISEDILFVIKLSNHSETPSPDNEIIQRFKLEIGISNRYLSCALLSSPLCYLDIIIIL